ncbi:hypothetical protein VP01_3360g2 [Puccinia sorghi]|uniref:DUF7872 domain-containing protein n=1 Tax=Puccinia sorghi TaxID=27349 RepID=A0A0L6UWW4_9BASI|nr:hypothetical protein VP01_3360g2 [Puccinia sorghi]
MEICTHCLPFWGGARPVEHVRPATGVQAPANLSWSFALRDRGFQVYHPLCHDPGEAAGSRVFCEGGSERVSRLARRANNRTEFSSPTTESLAHAILSTNLQAQKTKDACQPTTLSSALWSKLNLNGYLLQYPGGHETSLEELAAKSGLLNFDCGIDKLCYAGQLTRLCQLCLPVKGRDWYVLVAAQEWNSYMNVVYQAVGFAMTMMQGIKEMNHHCSGIIPSMVTPRTIYICEAQIKDFFPDKKDDWAIAKAYLTFLSGFSKVHPTEGHVSDTKWWMQLVQGQIGLLAGEANIMDYAVIPDPVNQHDKWTYFIYQLSKTQDLIQTKLTQNSEEIISSGISTEQGIYGALKDGVFLIDHVHSQNLVNLAASQQSEMKLSIQLNLLAAIWEKQVMTWSSIHLLIWNHQKFFILRGSDPCDGNGENGASSINNQISYCDPDNIMMKIVQLKSKNKINSEIYNGHLVLEKYNFTAGFLTERAWKCQSNNNQFQPDVWNSSKPIKIDSECSFNLAVCDLTIPGTFQETAPPKSINNFIPARELREKGKSIAQICRNFLGLPI